MEDRRAIGKLCDCAREWTSLRLDGELSEFEGALLDAHLARCARCREFARGAATVTVHLRQSALEPLGRPIARPTRRRAVLKPLRLATAAAAAVAVVVLSSVFGSLRSQSPLPTFSTPAGEGAFDVDQDLRAFRREDPKPRPVVVLHTRSLNSI